MTNSKKTNQRKRLKSRQKHNVYKVSEKKKRVQPPQLNQIYYKHTKIMWPPHPPSFSELQLHPKPPNTAAIQCGNGKKRRKNNDRNSIGTFFFLPLNSFCSDWWVTAFTGQSGSSAAWRMTRCVSHGDECIFTVLQTVVSKIQTRQRIWPGNTHLPCCKLCWDFCFATQRYNRSLIIKTWWEILGVWLVLISVMSEVALFSP